MRAVLIPATLQGPAGTPLQLEVDVTDQTRTPSCIPLCAVTNPRSAWNKIHNIHTFLRQIGPDIMILSEHWGRKRPFENILALQSYKVKESSRGLRGVPTKGRNGGAGRTAELRQNRAVSLLVTCSHIAPDPDWKQI